VLLPQKERAIFMNVQLQKSAQQTEDQVLISSVRKSYVKPQIIHEFELETRAGSPLPFGGDPLDPTNLDLNNP
jgi:hypothetical protein